MKQYQVRLIKDTGFCGNFYKLLSKKAKKNFLWQIEAEHFVIERAISDTLVVYLLYKIVCMERHFKWKEDGECDSKFQRQTKVRVKEAPKGQRYGQGGCQRIVFISFSIVSALLVKLFEWRYYLQKLSWGEYRK